MKKITILFIICLFLSGCQMINQQNSREEKIQLDRSYDVIVNDRYDFDIHIPYPLINVSNNSGDEYILQSKDGYRQIIIKAGDNNLVTNDDKNESEEYLINDFLCSVITKSKELIKCWGKKFNFELNGQNVDREILLDFIKKNIELIDYSDILVTHFFSNYLLTLRYPQELQVKKDVEGDNYLLSDDSVEWYISISSMSKDNFTKEYGLDIGKDLTGFNGEYVLKYINQATDVPSSASNYYLINSQGKVIILSQYQRHYHQVREAVFKGILRSAIY